MSELFVGYRPLTGRLKRRILKFGLLGVSASAGLAALLLLSQRNFDPGVFEFGHEREFTGWISSSPVPSIRVSRPARTGQLPGASRFPLVSVGKFGAPASLLAMEGRPVKLAATLIFNNRQTMLEVSPGSWSPLDAATALAPSELRLSAVDLVGEIVDSKCFFGVMKPGRFKVHRGCAVRCISGGIPPVLLVQGPAGEEHFFLVGPDRRPIHSQILGLVAEPVRVQGDFYFFDNLPVLMTNPAKIKRLK